MICSAPECRTRLLWTNKSGLCQTHYNERRARNVRRCAQCGDRIGKGNKTGLCQRHYQKKRPEKHCGHCGEHLEPRNKCGFCARHTRPRNRVPLELRPQYDFLVRAQKMAPADALALVMSGPVETPKPAIAKPVLASEIIAAVAAELRTLPELITSPSRFGQDVRARACVVQIFRRRGMSFPAIGARLGGRDHSSIINSYRMFDSYADKMPALRRVVERVMERAA